MMKLRTTIINGTELTTENERLNVLVDFYKAFNMRDMELMEHVWHTNSLSSMNNPVGGIKHGWEDIKSMYERIFYGKAKVYVEFYDFSIHETESMFFATGRERGFFFKNGTLIDLEIRTSRIFTKVNGKWKQIQHHGSIDNADLLKRYQEAVLTP